MTKANLVDKIAELGITKRQATKAVELVLDTIKKALKEGEKVSIVGFGTFKATERRARMGRNPKTGVSIAIPPKRALVFKPGQHLRRALNAAEKEDKPRNVS